jgi:membrane associated rhomboid family serine protease
VAETAGEGATSLGTMVPVHLAKGPVDARVVAEILEGYSIPAIVDSDLELVPKPSAGAHVLVPSTQLEQAAQILRSHDVATWIGIEDQPEDDDERPLALQLPEPSPLAGRRSLALGSIALGLIGQRWLEQVLGVGMVSARFGARDVLHAPWKLVTASFLHSSVEHMLSNALFGLLLGVVLFGTHQFGGTALAWLLSSIAGIGMESLLSPESTIIGASAGNYGLVGLWAHGQLERSRIETLPRKEQLRTVGFILLLAPGALTPVTSTGTRIAVMAHAVGFVAGFFVGVAFPRRLLPEGFRTIEARSRIGAVISGLIVAAGIGAAAWLG